MTALPARRFAAGTAALLAFGAAGCGSPDAPRGAPAADRSTPAVASSQPSRFSSSEVEQFTSPRLYQEVPTPTRVRIPSKGIDSRLDRVGLAPDGTIAAPAQWQQAAWYDRGLRPGQDGPAVIVGHVDSKSGPAVFARLGELRTGQSVLVDRTDGTTEQFRVTQRRQYAKAAFPARDVYSPTLKPSLLLITCGGRFDRSSGHYRDNVIVTAVPG